MNNRGMSRMLKWISAIVIAAGVLFCVFNLAQFNDRNLGLMVGIGFLVGGIQIMIFGVIAPLMQRNQQDSAPATAKEPV